MKNFVKTLFALVCLVLSSSACRRSPSSVETPSRQTLMSRRDVAAMLASLPIGASQMDEVYCAVSASSSNGYDEEYMMRDLLSVPGSGVGSDRSSATRSSVKWSTPLKSLIEDYLAEHSVKTRSADDVQAYLDDLAESGLQIYWPYSQEWDGETLPLITFDPGSGSETNYAYVVSGEPGHYVVTDSVFVDENTAMERPVWVINNNDDSGCVPLDSFMSTKGWDYYGEFDDESEDDGEQYNLYIRDFTMLRNYDTWFAGASEFHVFCGAVDGFHAKTEAELRNYTPEVTDFIVVVRRGEIGKKKQFNAILVTDFSNQLDKLAFLISEDDGGTITSWKCSASVKIKSKTYGFDLDIPLHQYDDVVWRGQLGATFFNKGGTIEGRFGDVMLTFALE